MMDFETDAMEHDKGNQHVVPTKDRGFLEGREITREEERQFLLKQLADARRKKK